MTLALDPRFVLHNGGLMPFGPCSFAMVYSWFMIELREIACVTKIGGFLALILTRAARGGGASI